MIKLLLLALVLATFPATAGIIFDNTNGGIILQTGWAVTAPNSVLYAGEYHSVAQGFQPTEDVVVSDVSVWAGLLEGANAIDVSLRSDLNGLPGQIIEEWNLVGGMQPWSPNSPSELTLYSLMKPVLLQNTMYWVLMAPGNDTTVAGWNWVTGPSVPNSKTTQSNGTDSSTATWDVPFTNPQAALRVDGTAVPEPPTLVMLALAMFSGCCACCRREGGHARTAVS
jgi:hypothetical protein